MDALVPQFSSISIEQITDAFAREVVSHAKVNLSAVIRENLPMWESKLFPVIGMYDLSKYEVVADILVRAGVKAPMDDIERAAFVKCVANAVRSIKRSNGELTATQKRAAARTALVVGKGKTLPPVVHGANLGGVVQAVPSVVQVEPMREVPKAPMGVNGQSPSLVPVNGVVGVGAVPGGFSFKTALIRLKNEPAGTPWNELDDQLHEELLKVAKERGASTLKDLIKGQYIKLNEQSLMNCFNAFQQKVGICRKVL